MKKGYGRLFGAILILVVIIISTYSGYALGREYTVEGVKKEMLQAEIEKEIKSKGTTAELMTDAAKAQMKKCVNKEVVMTTKLVELLRRQSLSKEDEMFVIEILGEVSSLD